MQHLDQPMTPEERCRQIEKMLRVRRLELRGATPGEKAAATVALDKLLTVYGVPDHSVARAELDHLQGQLDKAPPGARIRPPQPQPVVYVRVQHVWTITATDTSTTTTGGNWGWW